MVCLCSTCLYGQVATSLDNSLELTICFSKCKLKILEKYSKCFIFSFYPWYGHFLTFRCSSIIVTRQFLTVIFPSLPPPILSHPTVHNSEDKIQDMWQYKLIKISITDMIMRTKHGSCVCITTYFSSFLSLSSDALYSQTQLCHERLGHVTDYRKA